MNIFERFLYFLQGEAETPKPYGWYHLICIALTIVLIIFLCKKKSEKNLKVILGVYGIIALILEILKQLIWAFHYDNVVTWEYTWYSFPFQLCTTPIIISLVCLFLKEGKVRNALLSYMAYITILGSYATIFMPNSCFVNDILINIHTMWLHCGSLVISMYLLITEKVEIKLKNVGYAIIVFIGFVAIADILNILVYNSGVLNGDEFNMFYISPYFISSLPVFDIIQKSVPYIIYLLIYIALLSLGGVIIFGISYICKKMLGRKCMTDGK